MAKLHTQTISRLLFQTLIELMRAPQLQSFRLGDSMALALLYGHRYTKEIDLYSDKELSDYDYQRIRNYVQTTFGHGEQHCFEPKGKGTSCFISNLNQDYGKIDIYFGFNFSGEANTVEQFRFLNNVELMAYTLERIRKGGSKADFWDIHFLFQKFSASKSIAAHKMCFPEVHNKTELRKKLTDFNCADDDPDPKCLLKKNWQTIKLDLIDSAKNL